MPPKALPTPAPSASLCNLIGVNIERFKLFYPMVILLLDKQALRMLVYNTLFNRLLCKRFISSEKWEAMCYWGLTVGGAKVLGRFLPCIARKKVFGIDLQPFTPSMCPRKPIQVSLSCRSV